MWRSLGASFLVLAAAGVDAGALAQDGPDPALGLSVLRHEPLQGFGLDRAEFDRLWTVWPEALREVAAAATPDERRAMTLRRYGLFTDGTSDVPMAFAARPGSDRWTLSCLACHAGRVDGRALPGLPGNEFAFQTLFHELGRLKARDGTRMTRQEAGMMLYPLGGSAGTTNAQMFSVVLASLREDDLSFRDRPRPLGSRLHPDLDAPPLWHLKEKSRLYIDGYLEPSPRGLMQFTLGLDRGPERVREQEENFEHVMAWIRSLEPPAWEGALDGALAAEGRVAFERHCAECHGHHGADGELLSYPERSVPLGKIGTDPLRARAMPRWFREFMGSSWLGYDGEVAVELDPDGYVAPPLTGVWATAPYFHGGSVPTLWHVLHPDERPAAWRALEDERGGHRYDDERLGLAVEARDEAPDLDDPAKTRRWFDTSRPGKSAAGHRFPNALSPAEKRAVLEFLKTL